MGPNKGDALSICPTNQVEKLTNLSKSEQIKVTFVEPYSAALGFSLGGERGQNLKEKLHV